MQTDTSRRRYTTWPTGTTTADTDGVNTGAMTEPLP
jgi:hypothetical protein